jgi:hypothetical protein
MEDQKQDKPIGRMTIKSLVENSGRRLASFLTEQSERLTRREKKIVLLLFGLLAACASTALVVSPFVSGQQSQPTWKTTKQTGTPKAGLLRDDSHMIQQQSTALRALDSLYARDPKRFMRMIERRLAEIDSAKARRKD